MKRLSRFRSTILLFSIFLLVLPTFVSAEDSITYKDTQTDLQIKADRGEIAGPHMVYVGVDSQGKTQVFYRNIQTGQEKKITDTPLEKISPLVAVNANGQVVIVWEEKKGDFRDVYSHNLSTGVTQKLNQTDGVYTGVETDGNFVVYSNVKNLKEPSTIIKLSDGTQTLLDKAANISAPQLYKGKVGYYNLADKSVYLVDLATDTTKQVYKADNFYPSIKAFNGKYYFMMARVLSTNQSKHMLLNVETGETTDLDGWDKDRSFGTTVIGDHYAAYLTKKETGEVVINWVDLDAGKVQEMKGLSTYYSYFEFDGDQLLMNASGADSKLIYRTLNGTEDKLGALLQKPAQTTPPSKAETVASEKFSDVKADAWYFDTVQWAVDKKMVSGYPDGTFQPNRNITEAEFLTMFIKAFGVVPPDPAKINHWADAYYAYAKDKNWAVHGDGSNDLRDSNISRLSVAEIITGANGVNFTGRDSIQYLLNKQYSAGKTAATVDGYNGDDFLTRAEAIQFIKNVLANGMKEPLARPDLPSTKDQMPPSPSTSQ